MDISAGALERAIEDEEIRVEVIREIAEIVAQKLDRTSNLPEISSDLFRLISEKTGNPDPFKTIKRECNEKSFEAESWAGWLRKEGIGLARLTEQVSGRLSRVNHRKDFNFASGSFESGRVYPRR